MTALEILEDIKKAEVKPLQDKIEELEEESRKSNEKSKAALSEMEINAEELQGNINELESKVHGTRNSIEDKMNDEIDEGVRRFKLSLCVGIIIAVVVLNLALSKVPIVLSIVLTTLGFIFSVYYSEKYVRITIGNRVRSEYESLLSQLE
jgi:vacuolar-type H+-ATPase subunit H